MSTPPHLLHFRVSHYNEKVRWALDHKRWPHTREALVPAFHIPRVRWLTGQNQVPVLILEGQAIHGSARILAEIERRRPESPLVPENPALSARALALQAWLDVEVAPDLRRLFWSCYAGDPDSCARMATHGASETTHRVWRALFPVVGRAMWRNMGVLPEPLAAARQRLPGHLDRLAAEIGPDGFLAGSAFTVADLTAAAMWTALLRPPEFPYPLPEPWPQALLDLRASLADHPAARWVVDLYRRHRDASAEIGGG